VWLIVLICLQQKPLAWVLYAARLPENLVLVISITLHLVLASAVPFCVGIKFQSCLRTLSTGICAYSHLANYSNIDMCFDFHNRIYIVLQRKAADGTTIELEGGINHQH
jgi:hypothetical protein